MQFSQASSFGMLACALLAYCVVEFRSLTVIVDDKAVRCHFGTGLIRRTLRRADVAAVRPFKTRWYHGIGIHLTGHGWLCNVGGPDALEIELAGGGRAAIGTDDAQGLAAAIRTR